VPRRIVQLVASNETEERGLPAPLRAMLTGETPRAYLCTGTSCAAPTADLSAWQAGIESLRSGVAA